MTMTIPPNAPIKPRLTQVEKKYAIISNRVSNETVVARALEALQLRSCSLPNNLFARILHGSPEELLHILRDSGIISDKFFNGMLNLVYRQTSKNIPEEFYKLLENKYDIIVNLETIYKQMKAALNKSTITDEKLESIVAQHINAEHQNQELVQYIRHLYQKYTLEKLKTLGYQLEKTIPSGNSTVYLLSRDNDTIALKVATWHDLTEEFNTSCQYHSITGATPRITENSEIQLKLGILIMDNHGMDFFDLLMTNKSISSETLLEIIKIITEKMILLKNLGVTCHDMKAENITVTLQGHAINVKFIDFDVSMIDQPAPRNGTLNSASPTKAAQCLNRQPTIDTHSKSAIPAIAQIALGSLNYQLEKYPAMDDEQRLSANIYLERNNTMTNDQAIESLVTIKQNIQNTTLIDKKNLLKLVEIAIQGFTEDRESRLSFEGVLSILKDNSPSSNDTTISPPKSPSKRPTKIARTSGEFNKENTCQNFQATNRLSYSY